MNTNTTTVSASNARPTSCGVTDGVDVDVTITLDGERYCGEVTLAPDHRGKYVAYGNAADMWVSGALLARLQRGDGGTYNLRDVLNEIEAEAARVAGQA